MTDKNAIVQLAPNRPQLLRLKYPSGKPCVSPYSGPQVMFSTIEGPALFVPPEGAASIEQAGIRPGERFSLCKRQEGKETSWEVIRLDAKPGGPSACEPPGSVGRTLSTNDSEPIKPANGLSTTQSQAASSQLIAAIQAVKAAEEFAVAIGRPVTFEAADVRAIAISCFIEQARRSA